MLSGEALIDLAEKEQYANPKIIATAQKRWSNAEKITKTNIFLCYCLLAGPQRLSKKVKSLLKKFQEHHHLRRYLYQTKNGKFNGFCFDPSWKWLPICRCNQSWLLLRNGVKMKSFHYCQKRNLCKCFALHPQT